MKDQDQNRWTAAGFLLLIQRQTFAGLLLLLLLLLTKGGFLHKSEQSQTHAKSSMATAPAVEHSADWYDNDVLDASPGELLAIEYICCYCPSFLDTDEMLAAETQDDSVSRQRKTSSIWLVNERKAPIL